MRMTKTVKEREGGKEGDILVVVVVVVVVAAAAVFFGEYSVLHTKGGIFFNKFTNLEVRRPTTSAFCVVLLVLLHHHL